MKKLYQKLMVLTCIGTLALATGCSSGEPETTEATVAEETTTAEETTAAEETTEAEEEETTAAEEETEAEASYPEMELIDTSSMNLATVDDGSMRFSYDADTWLEVPGMSPLTVAYTETAETDQAINFNVQASQPYSGKLDEEILDALVSQFSGMMEGYMVPEVAELRLLDGEPIIYMETVTYYTDEMIDLAIEYGMITEEWMEELGGREVLLEVGSSTSMTFCTVADDYLFVFTGTPFGDENKEMVLDAMVLAAQTMEKL